MATLRGDVLTLGKPEYITRQEYEAIVNWISDIARAVNELSFKLDELEKEKNPTNVKLS